MVLFPIIKGAQVQVCPLQQCFYLQHIKEAGHTAGLFNSSFVFAVSVIWHDQTFAPSTAQTQLIINDAGNQHVIFPFKMKLLVSSSPPLFASLVRGAETRGRSNRETRNTVCVRFLVFSCSHFLFVHLVALPPLWPSSPPSLVPPVFRCFHLFPISPVYL